MRIRWWMPLCTGILLGLLASLVTPREWVISRYWWIAFIPFSLCIGILSIQIWNGIKYEDLSDEYDDSPIYKGTQDEKKRIARHFDNRREFVLHEEGFAEQGIRNHESAPGLQSHKQMANTVFTNFEGAERSGRNYKDRRKVKLTKVAGKTKGGPTNPIIGFEDSRPRVGKSYRVLTDRRTVITTSIVIEVGHGYIQTQNSCYDLQVLDKK